MKPYYYTFEWKDRVITLCLVYLTEDYVHDIDDDYMVDLHMGYAVKLPQDENKKDFAKQISLGRALKVKTSIFLGHFRDTYKFNIRTDKGILKSIARNCERNIKNGVIVIKGIK